MIITNITKIRFSAHLLSLIIFILSSITSLTVSADTSYKVKKTDNLNRIVDLFYKKKKLTRSQIMLSLYEINPNAFKSGDINFLIQGERLQLPDENNLAVHLPEEAKELLKKYSQPQQSDADFTLSALVKSIQESEAEQSTKEITAKQEKQSKKIKQLEQDGDSLRKHLEKLLSEKQDRDNKLAKLEIVIKKSLEEKNQALVTKKVEEKKREQQNSIEVNSRKEVKKPVISLAPKITEPQNDLKVSKNESEKVTKLSGESSVKISKTLWLIPLLLGFWFLLNKFLGGAKKRKASHNDTNNPKGLISENEVIDLNYEKRSIEASIKLDVAKAYLDMKDTQAASKILNEVVNDSDTGTELSKVAQELLQTV